MRHGRLALLVLAAFFRTATGWALDAEVKLDAELNGRVSELIQLHRYADAKETAKKAVESFSAAYGMRHAGTAMSLRNLALCHTRLGEYAEAEPLYLKAVTIREQVYGPKNPHTLETLGELADLYEKAGTYEKAELVLKRVLAVQDLWGEKNVGRARTMERLGWFIQEWSDLKRRIRC